MRFALLFALCLSSTSVLAAEMTADEIVNELVGQPIQWWDDGGFSGGELTLMENGAASLKVQTPRLEADAGRWVLRANRICTTWTTLRDGEAKCYTVRREGQDRFVTSGGNVFQRIFSGV